jgi:hypothetical protein
MKYKNFLQQKREELERSIKERKYKNNEIMVLSEKKPEKNIIFDECKVEDFNFHGIDKPKLKNSVYKTLSKLKPILTN